MKNTFKAIAAAIIFSTLLCLACSVEAQNTPPAPPDSSQCERTVDAIRLQLEKARDSKIEAAAIILGSGLAGGACILSQRLDSPDRRVRWAGYGILAVGAGYGLAKYVAADLHLHRAHSLTLSPVGVGYALRF